MVSSNVWLVTAATTSVILFLQTLRLYRYSLGDTRDLAVERRQEARFRRSGLLQRVNGERFDTSGFMIGEDASPLLVVPPWIALPDKRRTPTILERRKSHADVQSVEPLTVRANQSTDGAASEYSPDSTQNVYFDSKDGSHWSPSKRSPVGMVEEVLGRMNNELWKRDEVRAMKGKPLRNCVPLRLSSIENILEANSPSKMPTHEPHRFTRSFRFVFNVQLSHASTEAFEAEVTEHIWHIERQRLSSDVLEIADGSDAAKSARALSDGTISEHVFVPRSWRRISQGPSPYACSGALSIAKEEPSDEADSTCFCSSQQHADASTQSSDAEIEDVLSFLYHPHVAKKTVLVRKRGVKIVRLTHSTAESFEVLNERSEDVVFQLSFKQKSKRGPVRNVIKSRPFPVFVRIPAGRWRYIATVERGDLRRSWLWSLSYKVHTASTFVPKAYGNTLVTSSRIFETEHVSYEMREDDVATWRTFDVSKSSAFSFKGLPTMNVYMHNAGTSRLTASIRLAEHPTSIAPPARIVVLQEIDGKETILKRDKDSSVSIERDETRRVLRVLLYKWTGDENRARDVLRETKISVRTVEEDE